MLSASGDPWLWATDQLNNAVDAFDLAQPGFPVVATITDGINDPREVALDANGTLYVASAADNVHGYVTEYPFGQTSPSATLSGLSSPNGIAIAADGTLYVSNDGMPPGIAKYKHGGLSPSRYLVGPLIQQPWQMAFDDAGTLYLADDFGGVSAMKAGSGAFHSLHLDKLGPISRAIAIVPGTSEMFEGEGQNVSSGTTGRVYTLGRRTLRRSLVETTGIHAIAVGAIGGRTVAFYATYGPGDPIDIFGTASSTRIGQISNSLLGINGLAYKPPGMPSLAQR